MLNDQIPILRANNIKLSRFHWRKKVMRLQKTVSSVLLEVDSAEEANTLIRQGLDLEGELKDVELFDSKCLTSICYNCQGYGHSARTCKSNTICGTCAAPGHGREKCLFANEKKNHRCANCTGNHQAGSATCSHQKQEAERTQQAKLTKPRFFPGMTRLQNRSPTPIFDPVGARKRRCDPSSDNQTSNIRIGKPVTFDVKSAPATATEHEAQRKSTPSEETEEDTDMSNENTTASNKPQ